MIGHLGARTSALLDGQLSEAETERAWAHVHECHACRDAVEREGWVKRRLSGLTFDPAGCAPAHLKARMAEPAVLGVPAGDVYLAYGEAGDRRSRHGLVALGGGAVGAAVLGVLAIGASPASAPTMERPPASSIVDGTRTPAPVAVVTPPARRR